MRGPKVGFILIKMINKSTNITLLYVTDLVGYSHDPSVHIKQNKHLLKVSYFPYRDHKENQETLGRKVFLACQEKMESLDPLVPQVSKIDV